MKKVQANVKKITTPRPGIPMHEEGNSYSGKRTTPGMETWSPTEVLNGPDIA
jgi:hypothetical protein